MPAAAAPSTSAFSRGHASARGSSRTSVALADRPRPDAAPGDGRQRILDTAARLFRADGYAATSLRDIADACGMKAGSLYYHFASKDEIVGEVLAIGVRRVADTVRDAVATLPVDADARTLLGCAIRAHLSALHAAHDYTSANVRITGQVPAAVRDAHIAARDAYERTWAKLLKRCATTGRDAKVVRLFLIGAMNGSLEWFRGGPAALDRLADELTTLVVDGLGDRTTAATRRRR